MHEYSIVLALMDRIQQEIDARGAVAVHRVHVSLGEISGVDPQLLASAFDLVRPGTLCATAALDITRVPARWSCPSCGQAIPAGAALQCPTCQAPARLLAGDEIMLDQLEMEVP